MKKYFINLFLILFMATFMANAQVPLTNYQFETGVNATKWITLTTSATTLVAPNAGTQQASTVHNIGFDFLFGGITYSQYSVNTNGAIRFGSTPISSQSRNGYPFDADNISYDLPKIDLFGDWCGVGSDGYIKAELTGTAPNRVLVIEFKMGGYFYYDSDPNDYHWQVQLGEDNGDITIVYGAYPTLEPDNLQLGMATSSTDVVTISCYDNTISQGITSAGSGYAWPDANTFYHFSIPSCVAPISIVADNLTETSADISWVQGSSELQWQYICLPKGSELNWSNGSITCSQSVTINNLQAGFTYDFYIRSICAVGDTSSTVKVRFATNCAQATIPYSENFDSYTSDISTGANVPDAYPDHFLPPCWTFCNMSTSWSEGPSIWLSSFEGNDYVQPHALDSVSLHFLTGTGLDHTYAVLPLMDQPVGELMISFDCLTADFLDEIHIGVMTDPSDYATFVSLDTVLAASVRTHAEYMFESNRLDANQTYYIALDMQSYSRFNYSKMTIDNILVDFVPTCIEPKFLQSSNVSAFSAQLTWSSDATQFQVGYRVDEGVWNYEIANDTTLTLNNLSASTEYEVKVRAICSVGDTSNWGPTRIFVTECGIYSLPFSEDFFSSSYLSGYPCWRFCKGLVSDALNGNPPTGSFVNWQISSNGWNTPHVKVNIYGTRCNDWLVTPSIHIESNTDLTFALSFNDYNSTNPIEDSNIPDDKFYVLVSTDDGATWAKLASWGADSNDDYLLTAVSATKSDITLSLNSYSGQDVRIAFYVESTSFNGDNDLHLGDIRVAVQGPYCSAPQLSEATIEGNSATIHWSGEAQQYQVMLSQNNIWSDTLIATGNAYTFSNLEFSTDYIYQVRAVCDANLYSSWSESTFTTGEYVCPIPQLSLNGVGTTQATIAWHHEGNASTIECKLINGDDTLTWQESENSFHLTDLEESTPYQLVARALCTEDIYSEWGDTLSFTTISCAPVSNVILESVNETSATISWGADEAQSEWQIMYGMSGFDVDEGKLLRVSSTTYTFVNLKPNTTYDVYVRTVCGEDVSMWSNPTLTFTTSDSPESIDDVVGNFYFEIYPNPTRNAATISLDGINSEVSINIIDVNGRIISSETLHGESSLMHRIDVSTYPRGTYFIHLVGDQINSVRKLIVK